MTEESEDIRWQQRLDNYARALEQLDSAVRLAGERPLSDLEQQGMIQAFEFTHELAWQVMKDYFRYQGITRITGSRDAVREAYAVGLVSDGEDWMDMITSRNRTSHAYNKAVADDIVRRIVTVYAPLLGGFLRKMRQLRDGQG
jgi:nucleotidyltransferase substrate binding protein (TIGR01987 family)